MITFFIGKPATIAVAEPLDAATLGVGIVFEMLQTPDLFGERKTYRIHGLDLSDDLFQGFIKNVPDAGLLAHDVLVIVDKLLAADRKKVEKFATVHELKPLKESKEAFNAFALGNAFASGDRKKAWMVFQELLTHEDEMEKTHGLVWWKLKDMVQKKGVFTDAQLRDMARSLVSAYHDSRLGGLGMKERLELFFLTLPALNK